MKTTKKQDADIRSSLNSTNTCMALMVALMLAVLIEGAMAGGVLPADKTFTVDRADKTLLEANGFVNMTYTEPVCRNYSCSYAILINNHTLEIRSYMNTTTNQDTDINRFLNSTINSIRRIDPMKGSAAGQIIINIQADNL